MSKTEVGFEAWTESMGLNTENMTSEQLAGVYANFNGRTTINASDRAAVARYAVNLLGT